MTHQTRLSAKGQVVIPKDVRDRLGLVPGQKLDVTVSGGGVVLRAAPEKGTRSFEEITAEIRALVNYSGPSLSVEEMNEAIAEMWASGGPRWD